MFISCQNVVKISYHTHTHIACLLYGIPLSMKLVYVYSWNLSNLTLIMYNTSITWLSLLSQPVWQYLDSPTVSLMWHNILADMSIGLERFEHISAMQATTMRRVFTYNCLCVQTHVNNWYVEHCDYIILLDNIHCVGLVSQ